MVQGLGPELEDSVLKVILGTFKAKGLVEMFGVVVVGTDFERELAASCATGFVFDSAENLSADALSAELGDYGDVVYVDERFGAEGGEAGETDRDADGITVSVREEDGARGMLAESRDDGLQDFLRQRLVDAHRASSVDVDKFGDRLCMRGIVEVGAKHLYCRLSGCVSH